MGCCSSNNNAKNPSLASFKGPSTIKSPHLGQQRGGAMTGPRIEADDVKVIGEKQRIDTPMATEENLKSPSKVDNILNGATGLNQSKAYSSNVKGQQKPKYMPQYFDISPKVLKKNKIYHLTNNFPVSKPYSNFSDWQKLLQKHLSMTEEELIQKILGLRNRNWIQEQIKLQTEIQHSNTASLEGLVIHRRFLQLREHFNWLIWAVAQFYFQQKFENKFNLPKFNQRKWYDGFEFRGLYIRVIPYEEAYFVQNELQALKYVQMELLELQNLAPLLTQQYGQNKDTFLKDIIMPLLCGISCGGFYLFGSPIIYMQELEQTKDFYRDNLNASKVLVHNNSIVQMGQLQQNYNSIQQMQAVQNQSNMSFSYLHNNINQEFVNDSLFKFMPILKNITSKNIIPIIDFEEFNENNYQEDQKLENIELKYILVNLYDTLMSLSETTASTMLLRFPCFINEDITFHTFPVNNFMEINEIKKLINPDALVNGQDGVIEEKKEELFNEDNNNEQNFFNKKFFSKHGWDLILMSKQGAVNENKRASNFYNQREVPLRPKGSIIIENVTGSQVAGIPNVVGGHLQTHNMLVLEEYSSNKNDLKSQQNQDDQNRYISPQKQTILRKNESVNEQKMYGNVLLAAYNYKKDFKIKYSMTSHNYSTNIENLFGASVDQVARIIEQSDNIYNIASLKELLHRKGLNVRFEWIVLSKLRVNQSRELVMIDILLRTMRKIVNEEIKIKSKVQHQQILEGGQALIEEFYQGNQLDLYKDVLIFYMNAILQKKFCKQKQVFDETLSGLFLSRMAILGLVFSLGLSKEEIIYLESKDILEDILETPSKNPVLFINSVQTYFKIDFKADFLRLCRQDKHKMLSKSLPITINDIKGVLLKSYGYFSIKEQAYFMLARSITHHSRSISPQKGQSKIKTKSEKDRLKQSFQKPNKNGNSGLDDSTQTVQSSRNVNGGHGGNRNGIGPTGLNRSNIQNEAALNAVAGGGQGVGEQDFKTSRNNNLNQLNKDQLSTIRQYKNIDKEFGGGQENQTDEFNSPPLNSAKLGSLNAQAAMTKQKQNDSIIDMSKLTRKSHFKPTQVQEIIMPSVMYKLKTHLQSTTMQYFDDSSKTYIGDTLTVLKSYYEVPNIDIVNEWVIVMESLLKDVYSVSGSESVLLEALVYQAILIYFFEKDSESLFKVLTKIRDQLFLLISCSPETILVIQILTGMFFEEQKEALPIEAEKSYLTGLLCVLNLYGDPRGRGNISIPYTLFLSWKLGLLSLAEDKKLHDSEFAEEIFDATLRTLHNHKKQYKEQQLQQHLLPQMLKSGNQNINDQQSQWFSQFEIEVDNNELKRSLFDIKKYRIRPASITVAGGISKSNSTLKKPTSNNNPLSDKSNVLPNNNNYNKVGGGALVPGEESKKNAFLQIPGLSTGADSNSFKSKSHVPALSKKNKNRADTGGDQVDMSDIDLDIEDENKNFFVEENFKNNEWYIGMIPFQHWSLYRQQITQIMQTRTAATSIQNRNNNEAATYQKQLYKEMLSKSLAKDAFYTWMLKFNPLMYQCGIQWSNAQIKEIIFCQNQQMVSSSGSSVVLSNHNMSHQSSLSSTPASAKEKRNMHLGSYSQILGKEAGGISKQDMGGVVFSWGSEGTGQLGLNIVATNQQQNVNLKVMFPRMIIQLRDEIIKEICCGHSHTLVINIHGQVFSWGLNEHGQLGLGPDAPNVVRKPILNTYLANIVKLSAGNEHSIGLTKNGELYVWGGGGLTGTGDMNKRTIPTKLEFFSKTKVQIAVCGGLHTVVVNKEGELYTWGSTEGGQLGLPQQQIMQLCQGKEMPVLSPQKVPKLEGHYITQVACGEAHTIVMTKESRMFGWGMSNYGQIGLGFSSDSFEPGIGMEKSKVHEPSEITSLKHERIQKIICGATFTLFQTDKGDLYGCGMNDLGQLGLDTFMEDIQTLEKIKKGKHHQTTDVTVPTRVICFQGIALFNIACGENHALAVSGDDKNMLWAWGMYKNGQLGLGEVIMKMNPRPVQTLCSSAIQRIACGSMHSVALIGDSSQISTLSPQYYANNDALSNSWGCDIKGLSFNGSMRYTEKYEQEDEVPDDREGKIKNPK